MNSYLEVIPEDLITQIVLYTDDYEKLISLYESNNILILFDSKQF